MPFTVKVDADFAGPTLGELEPVLENLENPIEVRWTGSRFDFLAYERSSARTFILISPDLAIAERTLWVLGGPLSLSPEDLEAAKMSLTSKQDQTWRLRVEGLGPTRGTLLLTKVVGDSLRSGKSPRATTSVALDCLLEGVHPADADVLLRLRAPNPRLT